MIGNPLVKSEPPAPGTVPASFARSCISMGQASPMFISQLPFRGMCAQLKRVQLGFPGFSNAELYRCGLPDASAEGLALASGPNEFVPACEGGPDSLKCYRLGSILPPVRPGGLTLPPLGQTDMVPPLQGTVCALQRLSTTRKICRIIRCIPMSRGKQGERARLHMRPHVRNIAHRSVSTENKRKSFSARA